VSTSSEAARFEAFFRQATGGLWPLPFQIHLATGGVLQALADIPTGLGKTAGAILAWVWRRRFAEDSVRANTPRRLIYCLPMRVLVEQTFSEAVKWLARLGLLAGEAYWTELGPDGLPGKASRLCGGNNGGERGYHPTPEASRICEDGWAAVYGDQGQYPIAVHLLLGGEDRTDWALWPERDAILIGTQDMLLSRALNRG
jgi:CRISPR-associated endonuclease/helicase Cas3